MLDDLLTEQSYEVAGDLDSLPIAQILRILNSADAEIPAAVAQEIPRIAAAVEAIAKCPRTGRPLSYTWARGPADGWGCWTRRSARPLLAYLQIWCGASSRGATRHCSRSSEVSEDDPEAGARDLLASGFGAGDVLVGIAASGRTPYVLGAVAKARAWAESLAASVALRIRSCRAPWIFPSNPNRGRKCWRVPRACARARPPSWFSI